MNVLSIDQKHLLTQLANFPDGIVVVDKTGSVCYANPSAQSFFGTESGTMVGRKWTITVRPGETIEHASGSHTLELRAAATTWGSDGALLLAVRDITERKRAERQLAAAMSDIKVALASEKALLDELDKKNKELIEFSITDGLTGLYNHRFIHERFEFEFKRVKRYGGSLSCMMIDIDHFKTLNDTCGHPCGDYVLRELSNLLRTQSREVDICGRYGGDEFLILTNAALEYAMQFATKLHGTIDGHVFTFDSKPLHVTVSIGLADFRPGMKDRNELIDRTDMALYRAKDDGRNCIRIWKEQADGGSRGNRKAALEAA
jgi:diguanylate cyclase (GGDEF)-like protein